MILLIQHQEGMELKLSHRLIHTITPTTNQVRLHSGQATSIQRDNQAKFTEIETRLPSFQVKKH